MKELESEIEEKTKYQLCLDFDTLKDADSIENMIKAVNELMLTMGYVVITPISLAIKEIGE